MANKLEKRSVVEWHSIADWLQERFTRELGREFDFMLMDHSIEKNKLLNGRWSIPATQIAVDECGFFVHCPITDLGSRFGLMLSEFQMYLATLRIDWTVFCYEQRWTGIDWECALNPTVVVTKVKIERQSSQFQHK